VDEGGAPCRQWREADRARLRPEGTCSELHALNHTLIGTMHANPFHLSSDCSLMTLVTCSLTLATQGGVAARKGVSDGGSPLADGSRPGLSLWAAHLPGVEVFPFTTGRTDSLPELHPPGSWQKLFLAPSPPTTAVALGPDSEEATCTLPRGESSTAMILFSPPHFIEVENLMMRMAALLPKGTQVALWI